MHVQQNMCLSKNLHFPMENMIKKWTPTKGEKEKEKENLAMSASRTYIKNIIIKNKNTQYFITNKYFFKIFRPDLACKIALIPRSTTSKVMPFILCL